jgi:hypothetical protein
MKTAEVMFSSRLANRSSAVAFALPSFKPMLIAPAAFFLITAHVASQAGRSVSGRMSSATTKCDGGGTG